MRYLKTQYGFVLLLLWLAVGVTVGGAQPITISIQPISGVVGTNVSVNDQGGARGNPCFAQIGSNSAQGIGQMAGSINYTVPSNLTAGATISFFCTVGSTSVRSNTVVFTVTPPIIVVQTDSDGDGLPDSRDNCPNQAGPVDNNGCPAEQPPQPSDSDGDGIPDNADACPNQPGPAASNGCAPSPVPLPPLPTGGPCVVATQTATPVNVREGTSTETAIIGSLNPQLLYNVIGRNADGTWLQIDNGGWVFDGVTRQGGDCSSLPQTDGAVAPVPDIAPPVPAGDAGALIPSIASVADAAPQMGNCQEMLPQLNALPNFVILGIVTAPDACAAAQNEIDDLFFNPPVQQSSNYPDCSGVLGEDVDSQGTTTFWTIFNRSPQATRDYLDSVAAGNVGSWCTLIFDLAFGIATAFSSPADEHVLPMALAYCYPPNIPLMTFKVQSVGVAAQPLRDFNDACGLFGSLQPLGSVLPANAEFFTLLSGPCAAEADDAGIRAFSDAVRGAFDAAAAANQGCAGFQTLENFPLPADLQALMPDITTGDGDCTGNFRVLATHNGNLGLETLYRILKTLDPCTAADDYAFEGDVPFNVVPPPDCIQGDTMTVGTAILGQTMLDKNASWRIKILALDRPLDEMCAAVAGQDGGTFAIEPSPTSPAFAANPTPTLPVIVANPTATLPVIVANPTATEGPDLVANPTATPPVIVANPTATPELPEGAAPPPADDGGDQQAAPPVGDGQFVAGGCFGCLPNDPLIPGGRVQLVMAGADANGNFAGFFALPVNPIPDVDDAEIELVQLSLVSLPPPIPGSPVSVSPDGELVGHFTQGLDPATLPPTAQHIIVTLTDGNGNYDTRELESISLTYQRIDVDATDGFPIALALSFPPGLTPSPHPPAWSADGNTMYISLINSTGMTSIYALQLGSGQSPLVPFLVVENAFAPSTAPNGRYLAFERNDPGGRNIYALVLDNFRENPITQQMPGAECFAPHFGLNSLEIFFNCQTGDEQQMFVYGLQGVAPINTGIPNARNPIPAETDGLIYFDDGSQIYLSFKDGSSPVPYSIMLENVLVTNYSVSGAGG